MPESVLEDAKKAEANKKNQVLYEEIGKEKKEREMIMRAYKKGRTPAERSDFLDIPLNRINEILEEE